MQNLAAYLFGAEIGGDAAMERLEYINSEISAWLKGKGSSSPDEESGEFNSLGGDGRGRFRRRVTQSSFGSVHSIELIEETNSGQIFVTIIRIVFENSRISVFIELSITSGQGIVAPVNIYPKCPKIVRTLLESYSDWTLGGRPVPTSSVIDASGDDGASTLCGLLKDYGRHLPVIVVSADPDEMIWHKLPQELAREMAGLAHVASVDELGSWALTDEFGAENSCYLGAVRLYWPVSSDVAPAIRSTVWTQPKLATFGEDVAGMRRFMTLVRGKVMSAAATTLTAPPSIRRIGAAALVEHFDQMEKEVRDKELNDIVEENHDLKTNLDDANAEISRLKWKVAHLESRVGTIGGEKGEGNDGEGLGDSDLEQPQSGEVRYYKKIGNKGGVDELVRTGSCNHKEGAWKSAFKADQAEKGILKLEGRKDWQSLQHCGACTGGGRWRVRW